MKKTTVTLNYGENKTIREGFSEMTGVSKERSIAVTAEWLEHILLANKKPPVSTDRDDDYLYKLFPNKTWESDLAEGVWSQETYESAKSCIEYTCPIALSEETQDRLHYIRKKLRLNSISHAVGYLAKVGWWYITHRGISRYTNAPKSVVTCVKVNVDSRQYEALKSIAGENNLSVPQVLAFMGDFALTPKGQAIMTSFIDSMLGAELQDI